MGHDCMQVLINISGHYAGQYVRVQETIQDSLAFGTEIIQLPTANPA